MIASLFTKPKQGLGIELTPERVNIALLEQGRQGIKLSSFVSVPLNEGAIEEGRIMDTATVAEAIRQGLEEKKIKAKNAISAIPMGDAVIRLIRLPAELSNAELREMVLYQEAPLYLPFPREEADVDYQKLGSSLDDDGIERVEVLLVGTLRSVTDTIASTFIQAGVQLTTLEVSSFALMRTMREQLQQLVGEAVAIVDIGYDGTEISIVKDGIPQFNRKVPIGTARMQEAISRAMNLPPAMGVDLLSSLSVPVGQIDGVPANPSSAAILRVLGDLSDEIRRSIDFYLNQGETLEISQLLLAGVGAGIGQIDDFFNEKLNYVTLLMDPIANLSLQVSDELSPDKRPGLGTVIGLGLRGVL
ncbi:type IV pilus assembly protein PilM [Synechococcus sp. PCC 6312]|uniref:type IV pilus assembly protein PilM n=1 Tax=Synechococcus sp. (strain ATCC 27167 / PCC 6312) TaxID=195253 RepID=UPI00029F23A0|nr:type IV pilus assembly protein PilM [Synechococcus sp. PCC 6312]AFY60585.1 type IV pilus assembly protein PilM [Synechococcus sp. PCC 6312]